jgi:aspartyl-tRNA(Asn)/glutamyl-tRNA(Gln) amidotransferase subunit C
MPDITREEVAHLARLARIDLSGAELDRLVGELDHIVSAVAAVSGAVSADVPATSHPIPLRNVTRPDVVAGVLSAEEALSGAPEAEDGRFRVPRILDDEQ